MDMININFGSDTSGGGHYSGPMDDTASLERFGTLAFSNTMMDVNQKCTDADGNDRYLFYVVARAGAIELGNWFAFVPLEYRDAVEAEAKRIFPRYNKTKLTRDALASFVAALQRSIWDNVEPVRCPPTERNLSDTVR